MRYFLPALVVDDLKVTARVAAAALKQIGFEEVDTAQSGEEALKLAYQRPYGLIVSDLQMQPMNGAELMQHLKADARTASVPIIIMTAEPEDTSVSSAKLTGVSSFLLKPPTPGMLRERLEDAIRHFD